MDPVSVALGCIALLPPIAKATKLIGTFVLEVRDARKEMDMVRVELQALQSVLEVLAEDMKGCPEDIFPINLVEDIKSIIADCEVAVKQIQQCIAAHTNDRTSKSVKWALFGRESMLKHRSLLHAYQKALNMAIETLNMSISKGIKADTTNLLAETSEIKEDTSQILQEIAKLQAKLPDNSQEGARYILRRYFDSLTTYAESSLGRGSTQNIDDESAKATPLEEQPTFVDENLPLYQQSSSTTTQSHHPSLSTSDSGPSLQALARGMSPQELLRLQSLSMNAEAPLLPSLRASDASWCENRENPISIPHPQYATDSHTDLVYSLCQTRDFIISGSRDQSIRVWNRATRRLAYSPLLGHNASVFSMVADQDADALFSCGGNGSLIVWQLSSGSMRKSIRNAHTDRILSIKMNTRYVVSTSNDCTAKVWTRSFMESPGERRGSEPLPHSVLRGHKGAVNDVILTEGEVITACGDRKIRVFDMESGTCIRQISSHEKNVVSLALSADGEHIISTGRDPDVFIHHKQSGQLVSRFQAHNELIRAVMVIHEASLIVTGSYDETVAIWACNDHNTWKKERRLDVKETQRVLGLQGVDFTESVRNAITTGTEAAATSSGVVICMLSTEKQILCGAGCTIVGWDFGDELQEDEEQHRSRTNSSASRKKLKGKRQHFLQHLKDRF